LPEESGVPEMAGVGGLSPSELASWRGLRGVEVGGADAGGVGNAFVGVGGVGGATPLTKALFEVNGPADLGVCKAEGVATLFVSGSVADLGCCWWRSSELSVDDTDDFFVDEERLGMLFL
jgi:hypothetical protein